MIHSSLNFHIRIIQSKSNISILVSHLNDEPPLLKGVSVLGHALAPHHLQISRFNHLT